MDFYSIIILGYILIAVILIYIFLRDSRDGKFFLGRYKILAWLLSCGLFLGILIGIDARFVEPRVLVVKTQSIDFQNLNQKIKIAFVSDLQVGEHKKSEWVKKIVEKIDSQNPDAVIFGGDLVANEAAFEDETVYLVSLAKLSEKYPSYYIMGNHEYGIGRVVRHQPVYWTGDQSDELAARMEKMNIKLLKDDLACLTIGKQEICFYGIDDIWKAVPTFKNLDGWNEETPLVFLTHNPDGAKYWPEYKKRPDLVVCGHSHGGQIRLPFIGPIGNADIQIGKKYYAGLNPWQDFLIYTSTGAGESGSPIRFGVWPSVDIIEAY